MSRPTNLVARGTADAAILAMINSYIADNGFAPSIRDLQEILKIASTSTIHKSLLRLREAGKVDWVDGKNRTLRTIPGGGEQ